MSEASDRRSTPARRLRGVGYGVAATLAQAFPEAFTRPLFRLAADIAWRRRGSGVRQLEANLRRVVGSSMPDADLRALSRCGMRSYARYWLEFFRLPVLHHERIVSGMAIEGEARLQAVVASGRGVVLALPHTGNWDHAGAWAALRGYSLVAVAERLQPESLFDRFVGVRERLGIEVVPLTGDRNAFAVLLQRLRAGKVVCLVTERDISDSGVEVCFFGEPTTMPAGPAALALATGAALLPAGLWFTGEGRSGGWAAVVHPEIAPPAGLDRKAAIADMTQRLADVFAGDIAKRPQDWHMLQPLWSADRGRHSLSRVAALPVSQGSAAKGSA